ncbi:MAG: XRE family transcriptional regulator [Holophagales bacterium]|nr:XRE family transcriptional regulator [Holophagales bacterium]
MDLSSESLRYILGLKLRHFRLDRGWGLKEVAKRTGVSISYLSEIEKGRKYPKPDKLIQLSQALDVPYEELVSPKVDEHLTPVRQLFASTFFQEFPFHLFGIEPEQVVSLVTEAPSKAGALLRTFLEIFRSYDMRVEHFLFAALRSYQQLRGNYFEEIEEAAEAFLEEQGWLGRASLAEDELRAVLETRYGYEVDDGTLSRWEALADLRSVYIEGDRPRLLINERLLPSQRAFALGRELGYLRLGLDPRSETSGYLHVGSFDQVVHDFMAAYFSGALLIQKDLLLEDLETFFGRDTWSAEAYLEMLYRYRTTPETFFYRLSQLLPRFFGFESSSFVRFSNQVGSDHFQLTKILNMSRLPIPLGIEPDEHYCRRWPGLSQLRELAEEQTRAARSADATSPSSAAGPGGPHYRAAVQRSRFVEREEEYLIFTLTRPLSLSDGANTSISLGFRLGASARERIRFWDDPAIRKADVHTTCERCPIEDCEVRAAPPVVREEEARRSRRIDALQELVDSFGAE